jgi:hypothetical protein
MRLAQAKCTGTNVIATFNSARRQENPPCNVSLSIPATYDAATPQQQVLFLINAERRDRGINEVQLDTTLLSQIAYNHAVEENVYNFVNFHQSPINSPNGQPTDGQPDARILVNPGISSQGPCVGEIVNTGFSSAQPIYALMYQDAITSDNVAWGHRQTILRSLGSCPTWVGIGITSSPTYGALYVVDFLGFLGPTGSYTPQL